MLIWNNFYSRISIEIAKCMFNISVSILSGRLTEFWRLTCLYHQNIHHQITFLSKSSCSNPPPAVGTFLKSCEEIEVLSFFGLIVSFPEAFERELFQVVRGTGSRLGHQVIEERIAVLKEKVRMVKFLQEKYINKR